ncbi:MAG: hypothetical protein H6744_09955 [Deltaproteobacteria bacterium]|nr:hypothetical protein [Deltaproteobacteria bacterium]MCB9787001.1 hypothetical protein [Deltaproteobacteria bacterium]
MTGIRQALAATFVGVFAFCASTPAGSVVPSVDIGVLGGALFEWSAPDQAGNAFGLRTGVNLGPVDVALTLAGVMPDGRVQARFASFWVEGRWHPFMAALLARDVPLSPYLLLGAGVAAADGAQPEDFDGFTAVRWTRDGPEPVVMVGAGLRYGDRRGLYASLDARALNLSHGGLVLAIGYAL